MDETDTTTGETIATMDHAKDVVVVGEDEEDGKFNVQLPDGGIVSTTSNGLEQLRDMDWTDHAVDHGWTQPPWEPDDPDPNPLDPTPNDPIGRLTTPQTTRTVKSKISYVCPECDGKFATWHKKDNGIGEDDTYHCPFCMTERGNFGDDPDISIEEAVEIIREKLDDEESAEWFGKLLFGVEENDQ